MILLTYGAALLFVVVLSSSHPVSVEAAQELNNKAQGSTVQSTSNSPSFDNSSVLSTCDQCTLYDNSYWCPVDFRCHLYDSTLSETEMKARCKASCGTGAGTDCIGFLQCYYGASTCGECLYLGGEWCMSSSTCYPRHLPGNGGGSSGGADASSFSCAHRCPTSSQCVGSDADCPTCDRFDLPLTCSKLFPVVIVSSISSACFLAALGFMFYKAHKAEKEAAVGEHAYLVSPFSGN
jgi:hypothetical protein